MPARKLPEVDVLPYRNPHRPRLGVEALTLADVHARVGERAVRGHHRLDFHQLVYVTAGRGEAQVDFQPRACAPGVLLHVRPGQVSRLPLPAEGHGVEARIVLFTAEFPLPLATAPDLLRDPLGQQHWQLGQVDAARLRAALDALGDACAEPDGSERHAELLRHQLAVLLLRVAGLPRADGDSPGEPDGVFPRFRREVERSFTQVRTVEQYAAALGYSVRTLARATAAAAGRTPKQVVDDRVALEAKRLLMQSDLTVAAVGRRVGFAEPTNFGRFFHRHTGMTPAAFRQRHL